MASKKEYLDYILEQLSGLEDVSFKPMMGEYIIYYRGKIVGGIYDDRFLIKPVKAAVEYMPDARRERPYEGAGEMLLVEEVDDSAFLKNLLMTIYPELPAPKKRAVSVAEMRRRDAETIAAGTPGRILMRRAAEGIFHAWDEWPDGTLILCGSGNNGGDGFSLAEILAEHNISCRILTLGDGRTEDAAFYEKRAVLAGVSVQKYESDPDFSAPLIVDCLLGTGFQGEVREPYASAIRRINRLHEDGCRVISADINSGMNGDDGSGSLVVRSDLTVTIGLMKTGFLTAEGKKHYQTLTLAKIGIL